MVLLSVKRGEEVVNLQNLYSTRGHIDKVNKEKVEKKVEEKVKEEALLLY